MRSPIRGLKKPSEQDSRSKREIDLIWQSLIKTIPSGAWIPSLLSSNRPWCGLHQWQRLDKALRARRHRSTRQDFLKRRFETGRDISRFASLQQSLTQLSSRVVNSRQQLLPFHRRLHLSRRICSSHSRSRLNSSTESRKGRRPNRRFPIATKSTAMRA